MKKWSSVVALSTLTWNEETLVLMVISGKRGRRGRIRPRRPLIVASPSDEAPVQVPPTTSLRDYVNPIFNASTGAVPAVSEEVPDLVLQPSSLRDEEDTYVDASQEAPPAVGIEESQPAVEQQDGNEGANSTVTVPPIKKRGRGPAKGTMFERLRKMGKIPLNIKDGHRGPSCENATIFTSRVSWIIRVHADMRHASWSVIDEKEKHELINRVRVGVH
ncbi:uncharacterized protein LOC122298782 [Carya illinoinensis]|uniref:uncharacterized protein LOC122298782 n=1 Tax=Carya illinoinensis TaxID=32201 RepID=UPI001C72639F|nr:uncharacterized protein LOC122298782 [Carya illinoinensis]